MRLSKLKPIIASILLAEIIALLLAPMAYYALFVPKSISTYGIMQTFPLTNSQIKAAWPNLPTAQQIIASGQVDYSNGNVMHIENCTMLNLPNYLSGGVIPVVYDIFLLYNSTANIWIEVPYNYLATTHPPSIPSQQQGGFLGTRLPTEYGIVAVTVIAVTVAASAGYIFSRRKRTTTLVSS
jgi:hypothetical protein